MNQEESAKRNVSLRRNAPWIVVPGVTFAVSVLVFSLAPGSKFASTLFGTSILLFLFYGWRTMVEERLLEHGMQTTGKVIVFLSGHRGWLEVEYEADGNTVVAKCSTANIRKDFKKGEKVTVFFDPKKPTSFTVLEGAPFDLHT